MPYVDTESLRINFFESGAKHGRPVLLLHGWPDDASTREAVSSQLAGRDLRLIAPYLRGFCSSVFRNREALRTANGAVLAMDAIDRERNEWPTAFGIDGIGFWLSVRTS
ncbi:alpha/beta fold hydrolase, partial [Neorhizobium galegae]|uniref:alpha/beta fold hydrolase n=1 Tax=Neorhizobium galegae TaxID=399 RepID=UPI0039065449|nr:hypothetical protein [Neorhizobium galegae]